MKIDKIVEVGVILISLLLPLFFNPFKAPHFERPKIILFYCIVGGMLLLIFSVLMMEALTHHAWSIKYKQNRLPNHFVIPVLVYALTYICSTVLSIDPQRSLWGGDEDYGSLTAILTILFFFAIVLSLNSFAQIERIITALIIGSIPVAAYGVMQYFKLDPLPWYTDSISLVLSTLGRSILLGAYLIMIIPFTLSRLIGKPFSFANRSLSYLLILMLQVTCLFFTLARGALIAFIISITFFFYILIWRQLSTKLKLCVVAGSILSVPLLAFIFMYDIRWLPGWLNTRSMDYEILYRNSSNMARLVTWGKTLKLVPDRWLFGYGPEVFHLAYALHFPIDVQPAPNLVLDDPNNLLLYHLVSMGILGLFALIWIIATFYWAVFQKLNSELDYSQKVTLAAILSSFTAYLVDSQFNADVTVTLVMFWLILGIAVTIIKIGQSDVNNINIQS